MEVFATVEGKTIQGKANFHDGTPARNADVKAFDPAGEEIGRTKTDDQGKFNLAARFRCDHRLLVDTGDGHGAEYTILAKAMPADLPLRGPAVASADSAHPHSESDLDHSHDSALLKEIHADVDALQDNSISMSIAFVSATSWAASVLSLGLPVRLTDITTEVCCEIKRNRGNNMKVRAGLSQR